MFYYITSRLAEADLFILTSEFISIL